MKKHFSVEAFAEEVGVSKSGAWRIVRSGEIAYRRVRGRVIIPADEVMDFIKRHTVNRFDCAAAVLQHGERSRPAGRS